jgi:hypothetical protein
MVVVEPCTCCFAKRIERRRGLSLYRGDNAEIWKEEEEEQTWKAAGGRWARWEDQARLKKADRS